MECKICFVEFDLRDREPLVLPCAHSFCKSCVNSLPRKQCPTCREHFRTPQKNFVVLEIIQSLAADRVANEPDRSSAVEELPARDVKRCRCGSTDHFRTTHSSCPLNR